MEGATVGKRSLADSCEPPEFAESKRLRPDLFLLDVLDDENDREATTPDLVSVMKSLEDEIALPPVHPPSDLVEITPASGDLQPGLGYLLEASDDELGLPPALVDDGGQGGSSKSNGPSDGSEAVRFDELWGFYDDDIRSCDFGGAGYGGSEVAREEDEVFGGLFDYSDGLCEPVYDYSDLSWRGGSESLSAL